MRKSLNHQAILPYAIMFTLIAGGLGGSAAWAADGSEVEVSDDIGADGLKHRGDGSIDDHQPGHSEVEHHGKIVIEDSDARSRDDDGARSRDRTKITVNPQTGVRSEKTRMEVRNPDGSRTEVRTEKRFGEDGTLLRERTRTRERAARADRSGREQRPERGERADRAEREDRPERAERPERADRPERAERSERADRSDS